MNKLIGIAVLSLFVFAGCAAPGAAGPSSAGAATKAAGPQVAGNYAGKWSGSDGMSGEVRLALTDAGGGAWSAKVDILAQGDTIPTVIDTVKVDQTRVELVYHFEAEGASSQVKMKGQLNGADLAGEYQVSSLKRDKVTATGTWTATREP